MTDDFAKKNILRISYLLIAYMLCVRFLLIFSYSLDLDGLEFYSIYAVQVFAKQQALYNDGNIFPFAPVIINPVYPYFLKAATALFQVNPLKDIHEIYLVMRSFSFLLMLVNIGLLLKTIRLFSKDHMVSVVSVTTFLLLINGHLFCLRPDSLKLFFYLGFLYTLLHYLLHPKSLQYLIFSVLFCLLGFYTKQDMVVHAGINLFALLFIFPLKKALQTIAAFTIPFLLSFLVMNFVMGEYYFQNTILFNIHLINDISTNYNILAIGFSIVRNIPPILLLLYLTRKHYTQLTDTERFMLLTCLFTFILTHITMFRAGSFINYTFEAIILILVSMVILLHKSRAGLSPNLCRWTLVYYLVLFVSNFKLHSYNIHLKNEIGHKQQYERHLADKKKVSAVIKDETAFFINPLNVIFYPESKLVYGYDYCFDNYLKIYLHINSDSRLLFLDDSTYFSHYKNGTIKYILVEQDIKVNMDELYPAYTYHSSAGHFFIYAFRAR